MKHAGGDCPSDEQARGLSPFAYLRELSELADTPGVSLDDLLQRAADRLMAVAFDMPPLCASIRLDARAFFSANHWKTPHAQQAELRIHGQAVGSVGLCYAEEMPLAAESAIEERRLLLAVADHLSRIIAQRRAEETVETLQAELQGHREHLNDVITMHTADLRLTNRQLAWEIEERKRMALALQQAHDDLEIRVQERTAELASANKELEDEIARRKLVEQSLRESEERYRHITNSITDYIYNVSFKDGKPYKTAHSAASEAILGYTPEEFDRRPYLWFEIIHADDRERVTQFFADILVTKTQQTIEHRVYHKNRTIRWIANTIVLFKDTEGDIVEYNGVIHDITERKNAEIALQKSEERMSLVMESTNDALWDWNVSAGEAYFSPRYYTMLNYAPGAFPATYASWRERVHPDDIRGAEDALKQHFDNLTPIFTAEFRMKTRGGEWRWIFGRGKIVERDADGKAVRMVGTNTDIAARKLVEAELKTYQEHLEELVAERTRELQQATVAAEAANRAKSEFLANMSHEFRTPLNGILGYAQVLQRDSSLTDKQRTGLEIIQRSGDHLLHLINDLLDLSKIEAGRFAVESGQFNLRNSLRVIVDMFRLRAQQKGLEFHHLEDPRLPIVVQGDERCLRQILLNLLGNAIKFTRQGGVTLRVAWRGGDALRFEVADTGIGIAPDELSGIFLPFVQGGQTRYLTEGTGLGLAISQRLARLMGSEIGVTSAVNQGSSFWFDLALPEVECGNAIETTAERRIIGLKALRRPLYQRSRADAAAGTYTILIVDDYAVNRMVLREMLTFVGFELLEASSGEDAVQKAITFLPDAVLMDIKMPVMDGFEATRRIRRQPELKDVIVIALTALASEQAREQSLAAGCHDFLTKPVTLDALLNCLEKFLPVEWQYDEPDAAQTGANRLAAPLVPPSPQTLAKLYELARIGDIMALRQEIPNIVAEDARCAGFADKLGQWAKSLEINQIRELLESALSQNQK